MCLPDAETTLSPVSALINPTLRVVLYIITYVFLQLYFSSIVLCPYAFLSEHRFVADPAQELR
jgi:hypothetical protein